MEVYYHDRWLRSMIICIVIRYVRVMTHYYNNMLLSCEDNNNNNNDERTLIYCDITYYYTYSVGDG